MANFDLKDYIPVSERLEKFYADFPNGRVNTFIVEHSLADGFVLIKASVFRDRDDAEPSATGHAFEIRGDSYINKTSHVENCETSAVGRALALLGYEIKKGIASREEMGKVERMAANGGAQKAHSKPQAVKAPIDPFEEKKKECGALFRELNRLGDFIRLKEGGPALKWNSETITAYVQQLFEVNSIDDLSLPFLDELIADLKGRVEACENVPA